MQTDFTIQNHGSVVLLQAHSEAARTWVDEHIPSDAMSWAGATVVEPRYIQEIIYGIQDDGLSVVN